MTKEEWEKQLTGIIETSDDDDTKTRALDLLGKSMGIYKDTRVSEGTIDHKITIELVQPPIPPMLDVDADKKYIPKVSTVYKAIAQPGSDSTVTYPSLPKLTGTDSTNLTKVSSEL